MTKLITSEFKFETAKDLYKCFQNEADDYFYLYAGRYQDNNTTIVDTVNQKIQLTYNNMLFGKKIDPNNVALVTRYIPWESGKVFDMYDQDVDLSNKDFYCIVDEDSLFHVYKCLDNNNESPSTVEPLYEHFSSSDNFSFRTLDNYLWKYMTSVSYLDVKKFSTDHFFPIFNDEIVSSKAIPGSLDVIKIETSGKGYNNYTSGSFNFADIRVNGTSTVYKINSQQSDGFYNDCIIYLTSGTGQGQFATITKYYSNSFGNFIEIDKAFIIPPQNATAYEIYPKVTVASSGRQTINAIARALINSNSSNSVYRVEMLQVGENYEYATAIVSANAIVGVSNTALLKPIYSPSGGHGTDAQKELYCSSVCVYNKFANSESNTIPFSNEYNQIGLIRNPKFGNTQFSLTNPSGNFIFNEKILKMNPKKLASNLSITKYESYVIGVDTEFDTQLVANEYVFLKGDKSYENQLVKIKNVVNSTYFTTQSYLIFTSSNTTLYEANTSSECYALTQPELDIVSVTKIDGLFTSNDQIIGLQTGAYATINTISRSGVSKEFNTFIQTYKYQGTISRAFTENEKVYQGLSLENSSANATLYYYISSGGNATFYLTEVVGKFNLANPLLGSNSNGFATLTSFYEPELIYGSGEVDYIENIPSVVRRVDQSEEYKIIFEF